MSGKQNIFEKMYYVLVILVYFLKFSMIFCYPDPFHETDPDPTGRNETDPTLIVTPANV